jgi:hypothetical protein
MFVFVVCLYGGIIMYEIRKVVNIQIDENSSLRKFLWLLIFEVKSAAEILVANMATTQSPNYFCRLQRSN